MTEVNIPDWHVSPVSREEHERITALMDHRENLTGERQTKASTIRRAIRALYRQEVEGL